MRALGGVLVRGVSMATSNIFVLELSSLPSVHRTGHISYTGTSRTLRQEFSYLI